MNEAKTNNSRLLKVAKRDNYTCWLCGIEVPMPGSIDIRLPYSATIDHFVPLSHKPPTGKNSKHNLFLAHRFCNSSRGVRMPWDSDWSDFLDQLEIKSREKFDRCCISQNYPLLKQIRQVRATIK